MSMHSAETLEFYTQRHPRWFEPLDHIEPAADFLSKYEQLAPPEWTLTRSGLWFSAAPPGLSLPDQGWKLHVSVSTEDSVSAFVTLLPILIDEAVFFKYLLDKSVIASTNGKLWPRNSSGKFVTIYTRGEDHFRALADRISVALQRYAGPYILSDKRWPGSRSVFYRYGSFQAHPILRPDGTREFMILSPTGELVPDIRAPYWSPPDWIEDTDPSIEKADNTTTLNDGRFSVESALTFSNRGGVYKAIDTHTDKQVIIKEARPYVEIGTSREDAVRLLKKEHRLLEELSDCEYYVNPISRFKSWEHEFLVEEYIDGESIGRYIIQNHPVYKGEVTSAGLRQYFTRMVRYWLQLTIAILYSHDRGISLGDLSFTNIYIRNNQIVIFDLETANKAGTDNPVGLQTPGMSSVGVSEKANDYYSLGTIIFGSVMLVHGVPSYHTPARARFLQELQSDLALPEALIDLIQLLLDCPDMALSDPDMILSRLNTLNFDGESEFHNHARLAKSMVDRYSAAELQETAKETRKTVLAVSAYLRKTADPERDDRLFPADLMVFETNPLSVAYGASGVLHAMQYLNQSIPAPLIQWFSDHASGARKCHPGLYIGLAGVSWVLEECGNRELACDLLKRAGESISVDDCPDVLHGAAGYGLACLNMCMKSHESRFLDQAIDVGLQLIQNCRSQDKGVFWGLDTDEIRLGYAYGGSGIALFLLYLSQATGNREFLAAGRLAIEFELAQATWLDGSFAGFPTHIKPNHIDESSTESSVLSCYWEDGSAGIGSVLTRYHAVTRDTSMLYWIEQIAMDCCRKYTAFPQFFRGLVGLGNYLLDAWNLTQDKKYGIFAWELARSAQLYRIECDEGTGYLGEQARRESADFATGAAGVGMFLHRIACSRQRVNKDFNFTLDELL